ncbi:hypothetical protein [Nostoc sp. FACHB-888]|uniref:hypothetical protein n=1 Tax=Nostoc sp. FACHB-888 TaxID=2692842 RepID=UPI001F559611|nr:hypothetical protein [Nostoc sp. FACHB-888]
MPVPRLECIYGDEGCDYLYSKSVLLKPLPWTSSLAQLRDRITAATGYSFRIVIGNQYRSGQTASAGILIMSHQWDLTQQLLLSVLVLFANFR